MRANSKSSLAQTVRREEGQTQHRCRNSINQDFSFPPFCLCLLQMENDNSVHDVAPECVEESQVPPPQPEPSTVPSEGTVGGGGNGDGQVVPEAAYTDELDIYVNPIDDDGWVRQADLVCLDQLRDSEDIPVKQDLLTTFMSTNTEVAATLRSDPILEGMMWQERFIDDYKRRELAKDEVKATDYKKQMLERFRQTRTATADSIEDRPTAAATSEL